MENIVFTYTHPTTGDTVDLIPQNDNYTFTYNREGDEIFHRLKMESSLVYHSPEADWFLNIEDDNSINCEKIPVTISRDGQTVITGYVSMRKSKFDRFLNRVEFNITNEDDATCFLEKYSIKRNILNATPRRTVFIYFGNVATSVSSPIQVTNIPSVSPTADNFRDILNQLALVAPQQPTGAGWILSSANITNITPNGVGASTFTGTFVATWARVATSGGGSTETPILLLDGENSILNFLNPGTTADTLVITTKIVGEQTNRYETCRTLEGVLNLYANECGLTVKSNFFGINAVAGSVDESTAAYQYALQHFQGTIFIGDKGDIRRPTASDPATKNEFEASEFMEELKNTFNVRWNIEGTTLIVEHISHYIKLDNTILDLTTAEFITGDGEDNRYEYVNNDKFPRSISFSSMEEATPEFETAVWEFSPACTGDDSFEIQARNSLNDVAYISTEPDQVSNTGIVFFACEIIGVEAKIKRLATASSNYDLLNGAMAWENLAFNLHNYELPTLTFTANNVTHNAVTVAPQKQQIELELPAYVFTPTGQHPLFAFAFINPNEGKMVSSVGNNMRVDNMQFEAKGNTMLLQLIE